MYNVVLYYIISGVYKKKVTELVKKIKEINFNENSFVDGLELVVLIFVFITTTLAIAPIV